MIVWIIILLIIPPAYADIFYKPDTDEQKQLMNQVDADSRGFYIKGDPDYSVAQQANNQKDLTIDNVPLGVRQFNFNQSLQSLAMNNSDFSKETISNMMNSLVSNPLMVYQYSSPTQADLYKYLTTIANLRLSMRYAQYQDLERFVDDPLVKLRKQAEFDCLRQTETPNNMEEAFKSCFSSDKNLAFTTLDSPVNAKEYIHGSEGIVQEILTKVGGSTDNWDDVKDIIPEVLVNQTSVTIKAPTKTIRDTFYDQRKDLFTQLQSLIKTFVTNKTLTDDDLTPFYIAGVPLTEAQVRNIALLEDNEQYLTTIKLASQLAYLKTMEQYGKALSWLQRAMDHPAIEPGYKAYIRSRIEYIREQMDDLTKEKDRLKNYAGFMERLIDHADEERLKTIAQMNTH